jgi:hypothetical protein
VEVEMEVEVETVLEAAGRRRCGSALHRWYVGYEACLVVEKGMSAAVVTSIKRRRDFIGGGDARRGEKKEQE